MNKQQTADWLAENVLNYIRHDMGKLIDTRDPDSGICRGPTTLLKFIYSPDGFFTVWDAVNKKFPYLEITFSTNANNFPFKTANNSIRCGFTNHDYGYGDADWEFNQFGKDRYEAFYNAVCEAMNEKISTSS